MAGRPVVVDLFCGVGGLSLGAARAGFRVAAAVDCDPHALAAHHANFPGTVHISGRAELLSAKEIAERAGVKRFDGVIGGPPCQGFSCIGRRKRRDPRNHLFIRFFELVKQLKPTFFLVENVPGILAPRYARLVESALEVVSADYRVIGPMRITASDYGAPTKRERVFIIGLLGGGDELQERDFRPRKAACVTVKDALCGLPRRIRPEWQEEQQGWRVVRGRSAGSFGQRVRGMVPEGVGNVQALRRLRKAKIMRLDPNGFCPTLRAGTDKDHGGYQSIRPLHPTEDRVITPREGSRLQGFPDWFVFAPTKWHAFRQIGSSVSPILAEAVLRKLWRYVQ
ncbi:MAG: DNA cytosine methyltransferase [Planctomycetota bacterium]|nr:DNA cytosine methyltransferase [Planctomycetota bacterium]